MARPVRLDQPKAPPRGNLAKLETRNLSPRSLLRALSSLLPASQVLALADQVIVSATSFLVFVLIARSTDPKELGIYALTMSILAFCLAIQESLITKPYAIKLHEPTGSPAQHAFSMLVLSLALCSAFALVASAAAIAFATVSAHTELLYVAWSFAGAIPFVVMREFARRFTFAHLALSQALMLDIGVAVLTLIAAGMLYWAGAVSVPAMIAAIGFCCAVTTMAWLYVVRRQFAVGFSQLRAAFRQCWDLGKWFLWGHLGMQIQGYLTPWLALVLGGAAVAGLFAACASIVAFTNPVIFGFCNVLTPKFVRILKNNGVAALRKRVILDALVLGMLLSAFCLVVLFFGADIMRLLYREEVYAGHSHVLRLLALAALIASVGIPPSLGLAAAGRAKPVAAVMLFSAGVNTLLVILLLPKWGLLGAAYAVLIGEAVGAVGRWAAFWLLVPLEDEPGKVAEASSAWPLQV
jgi:O-antigen/teichoic acid export membrane protein